MQPIVTVMVLGFSVLMPYERDNDFVLFLTNLVPGTSVTFQMSVPEKYEILGFDDDESELLRFSDNTGKNLMPKQPQKKSGLFSSWLRKNIPSSDKYPQLFTIHTSKYPAQGASAIQIEAKLVLNIAYGEKIFRADNVTFKETATFTLAKTNFTILNIKPDNEKGGTLIILQYENALENEKSWAFYDHSTSKKIEFDERMSSVSAIPGIGPLCKRTFSLKTSKVPDSIDIVLTSYSDIKTEKVTINETVSFSQFSKKQESKKMQVKLIEKPSIVTAAGQPSKTIEEFIGKVNSKTNDLSIARMKSPAGWSEPAQTPEFDEYTLVLSGELLVKTPAGETVVKTGQAVIVPAGTRVTYSTPKGAEYIAVCKPAFSPDTVHRE